MQTTLNDKLNRFIIKKKNLDLVERDEAFHRSMEVIVQEAIRSKSCQLCGTEGGCCGPFSWP